MLAEARKHAVPAMIEAGNRYAKRGDLERAKAEYQKALEIDPQIGTDALIAEAQHLASTAKAQVLLASDLAREEKIAEALEAIQRAQALEPEVKISASTWNGLCWNGTLAGMAKQVIEACENAVALAQESQLGGFRDSRGLARARLGDLAGAAEDFRYFADWAEKRENRTQDAIKKRRGWANDLDKGENPITDQTLKDLKTFKYRTAAGSTRVK